MSQAARAHHRPLAWGASDAGTAAEPVHGLLVATLVLSCAEFCAKVAPAPSLRAFLGGDNTSAEAMHHSLWHRFDFGPSTYRNFFFSVLLRRAPG